MAIKLADLKIYAAATPGASTLFTNIGGGPDTTTKPVWTNFPAGGIQVVSSDAGDSGGGSVRVTVTALSGEFLEIFPTGQTPNPYGNASDVVLLEAHTDANQLGDIAIESTTTEFSGTLSSGTQDDVTLPGGASAVDDAYRGMVIRETNGSKRIRTIIKYVGSTKVATVSRAWGGTAPSGTTTVRIAKGVLFDLAPNMVFQVYRLGADTVYWGGSGQGGIAGTTYYDKYFIYNTSGADSLTSGQVAEAVSGLSGNCEFALETSVNGTGKNGTGNGRTVAPTSGVSAFDSSAKSIPGGGTLAAGQRIGVWIKFVAVNADDYYALNLTGTGIDETYDFPLQATGSSIHNYDGSGGITMGGSAGHSTLHSYSGTGGIVMGGAADTQFLPNTAHNYTGSGGIVTGGAARTYRVPNYKGSGGAVLSGAAGVTKSLTQVSFDILNAAEVPCPVFFDILGTIEAPNGVPVEFDIFEGPNGVTVSFDIYSGRLRTARTSEDVQQPVAKVVLT